MAEIPPAAIIAAVTAMNEAHAKRGWAKPAPWWVSEVVTAALEAAAPLLAGTQGVTAIEWGARRPDLASGVRNCGSDGDSEQFARFLAAGQEKRGITGALVRRTVTYGAWEEVPGEH